MAEKQGKILVIRGGAIGDFILTLPVLSALRAQFPSVQLEVLGYTYIAQLALAGGLAERVESIDARPMASFFARNGKLPEELANYFSKFDIIISYLYDPDKIFKANVSLCTRAQFIEGPHRPDDREDLHATRVFLKPLERLAIFEADNIPRLDVKKAFETSTNTGRWLAVHPGSGSEKKNWPEAKWSELLADLVKTTKMNFLLVGGEAERERVERLSRIIPTTRMKLLQSVPLPELATWLASCSAFIGHDSGISHLAGAVGVRSLILWGDTVEEVWRPHGADMVMLRDAKGLSELSVPVVLHHLEQLLSRV